MRILHRSSSTVSADTSLQVTTRLYHSIYLLYIYTSIWFIILYYDYYDYYDTSGPGFTSRRSNWLCRFNWPDYCFGWKWSWVEPGRWITCGKRVENQKEIGLGHLRKSERLQDITGIHRFIRRIWLCGCGRSFPTLLSLAAVPGQRRSATPHRKIADGLGNPSLRPSRPSRADREMLRYSNSKSLAEPSLGEVHASLLNILNLDEPWLSVSKDIEDIMDSAIRLREFSDQA